MPKRVDLTQFDCSIARTLDVVGDKWTLLILRDALYGLRRFDEFQADLGIARNVLTNRLKKLTDVGVLERVPYEPRRFEYRLTDMGRELLPVLLTMMRWGDRWMAADPRDPPVELRHLPCGEVTVPGSRCSECGAELRPRDLRVEPLPRTIRELLDARQAG